MKTYEVTIDRGSDCYSIEANTPEEAEDIAMHIFEKEYPSDTNCYDWWVGNLQDVTEETDTMNTLPKGAG